MARYYQTPHSVKIAALVIQMSAEMPHRLSGSLPFCDSRKDYLNPGPSSREPDPNAKRIRKA